jgi:hypothetical protein
MAIHLLLSLVANRINRNASRNMQLNIEIETQRHPRSLARRRRDFDGGAPPPTKNRGKAAARSPSGVGVYRQDKKRFEFTDERWNTFLWSVTPMLCPVLYGNHSRVYRVD